MTLYEWDTVHTDVSRNVWGDYQYGQSFTVGTVGDNEAFTLTNVKIWARKRAGGSPGTITVNLYAVDGSHKPTGTALSTGTFNGNTITTNSAGEEIDVTMSATILRKSTEYAFVVSSTASAATDTIWVGGSDYGR